MKIQYSILCVYQGFLSFFFDMSKFIVAILSLSHTHTCTTIRYDVHILTQGLFKWTLRTSLVVQQLSLQAGIMGSIPGQGTRDAATKDPTCHN